MFQEARDPLDNIIKTKEKVFHGQIILGSATLGRVELISFLVDFSAVFSAWVWLQKSFIVESLLGQVFCGMHFGKYCFILTFHFPDEKTVGESG